MDLDSFHFSHPFWLWILLALPLVWGIFFLYFQKEKSLYRLEKFIDKHLLEFLLVKEKKTAKKLLTPLLFWSFVWCSLALAFAGPRWQFREAPSFTRDQNLAILLDLSESMNAKDISPSRLGRAKQKIEDLLKQSKDVKIGLIAFAADPHMIVPMTEDKETIRHLLPSLDTDLVYAQGSKLTPALEMAAAMLNNEPGNNKAIVMVSDGGFEDASAIHTAKKLAEKGIVLYTLGVGSLEGAPLKDRNGALIKKGDSPILSKLEKEKFREISNIGNGRYFDADHSSPIALIFEDLEKKSHLQQETEKTHRFWEEHFYLFLLPALPFFLLWFRRGYIFSLLFLFLPYHSEASLKSFYNKEQQGALLYEEQDYEGAVDTFEDPYRKGVAYYRVGDFKAAEEMFQKSTRPEVACQAAYNLGNAFAKQNKLQEAKVAYEEVLKKWPEHTKAKENLDIVQKMLEKQKPPEDSKSRKKNSSEDKSKQPQEQQKQEEPKDQPPENQNQDSQEPKEKTNPENPEDEEAPPKEEEMPPKSSPPAQETEKPMPRLQKDLDADLWLDQIKNDPKPFLKNKFFLESKKNGTKEESNPW